MSEGCHKGCHEGCHKGHHLMSGRGLSLSACMYRDRYSVMLISSSSTCPYMVTIHLLCLQGSITPPWHTVTKYRLNLTNNDSIWTHLGIISVPHQRTQRLQIVTLASMTGERKRMGVRGVSEGCQKGIRRVSEG